MLHTWNSGSSIVQFSAMIMHLLNDTLSVQEHVVKNKLSLHTLPTHHILCHLTSFPKFEMAMNGRKFNLSRFKQNFKTHLLGFKQHTFEQWHHCIKSQGDYSECDNTDWNVNWCYGEIN